MMNLFLDFYLHVFQTIGAIVSLMCHDPTYIITWNNKNYMDN